MDWYRINLTRDQVQYGENTAIYNRLTQIILSAGFPKGVVAFEIRGEGAKAYTIFLSPALAMYSSDIITAYSGSPCLRPDPADLLMIIGSDEDAAEAFK
jgi:hypothetical protein